MIEVNYNEYKETIAENIKLIAENHNIKQEIERLKESEEYHKKGFAELHKRIEEAIEYIEENFTNEDGTIWHEEIREIYSILKGDEKSE